MDLDRTLILCIRLYFETYLTTHVVKNGQQEDMRYDEIGLCVPQYKDTIFCSIPTTIKTTQVLAQSFTHIEGPLHTQAKSHDHEIVRAQKKMSKGCPKTPPKSCSVVTDPQV